MAVGRLLLQRGAELAGIASIAPMTGSPDVSWISRRSRGSGRGIRDLVQQDRVGPVGNHRQVERLGIGSRGTRPPRGSAGRAHRRSAAGRRDARTKLHDEPAIGSPSVPSTTESSAAAAAGRTGRGRPPRASARRRGAGPAGRSPARPPPSPSGRPASGNAGLASLRWVNPASIARQATEGSGPLALVARPSRGSRSSTPRGLAGRGTLALLRAQANRRPSTTLARLTSTHPGATGPAFRQSLHAPPIRAADARLPACATILQPRSYRREDRNRAPVSGAGMMHSCVRRRRCSRDDARGSTRSSLIVLPQSNTNLWRRSNDRAASGSGQGFSEPSPASHSAPRFRRHSPTARPSHGTSVGDVSPPGHSPCRLTAFPIPYAPPSGLPYPVNPSTVGRDPAMPRSTSWTCRSDFGRRSRPASPQCPATGQRLAPGHGVRPGRDEHRPGDSAEIRTRLRKSRGRRQLQRQSPPPQPRRRHRRTPRSPPSGPRRPASSRRSTPPASPSASTGVPPTASTAAVTRSPANSATPTPAESATAKQLRELLVERLQLLEEFEKASDGV